MSGFLLPLGKDGAIVNYSLNWQVDWICGMDDEILLKYSFFLCAADGSGHPPTCPGTASLKEELSPIHHLTAVPQRKRVPINWCISLDDQTAIEVVPWKEIKRNRGNEHSQYNNIRSSVIKCSEVLSWAAIMSLKRERHYGNLIEVGSAGILQSGGMWTKPACSTSVLIELLEMQIRFNGICRQWPLQANADPPVEAVSMRRELWVIIALQADKDPLNLCKLFVSFHYIQSFLSELKEVETYQVCQSLLSFLSFTLSFSVD